MSINYKKLFENNPKAFSKVEPFLEKYLEVMNINNNFKVLDLGCFQGSNLRPLIELGVNEVYGVDLERDPLIAFRNDIYKEYGKDVLNNLNLTLGKVEEYKFPMNFDLITCFRVLQHVSKFDSVKLIQKIQNHTNTNGYNIFILWENGERYSPNLGYFTKDEITNLYKNSFLTKWEILECTEKEIESTKAIYFAARKI